MYLDPWLNPPILAVKYSFLMGCPVIFMDMRDAKPEWELAYDYDFAIPITPDEWIWAGCE